MKYNDYQYKGKGKMSNNAPDYEDNLIFLPEQNVYDEKDKIIEELKAKIAKLEKENAFMRNELNMLDN